MYQPIRTLISARRLNRSRQEVAPPGLSLRARLGGATTPARWLHHLGSVSERDWAVQPPLTEVAPLELGLRALAREVQPPQSGGGTAWGSVSEPDSGGATAPDREVQPPRC